ncbi:MAG: hypothetical protein V4521_15420 [Pseudomonadota bacterium]
MAAAGFLSGSVKFGITPPRTKFVEGQIWHYATRPGDEDSILKIQKIELLPEFAEQGGVYHVTIIDVHLGTPRRLRTIHHAPFSKAALEESVEKIISSNRQIPGAEDGISHWRESRGGIFTVSVADAVSFIDGTLTDV